ncbi:MAG: DUF2207 domain-containing protein, partial [Hyphomonas sp.]|nr:DUF2207 domain-containing protein [Hyphomonas sp.]
MLRYLLAGLAAICVALAGAAEERINRFDVDIEIQKDGDILVTETIEVRVEGNQIRRGIFRELPRYYADDELNAQTGEDGHKLPYQYDIRRITRDGKREPYVTERDGNAFLIRIGDEDVYLDYADHTYVIKYLVKNQIRYFEDHDELYWNATGTYWQFPIAEATARITVPEGAVITDHAAYVGGYGDAGQDYAYGSNGNEHVFKTVGALGEREGITVSLSLAKGLIDPPSATDKGMLWWFRYGALAALVTSFLGVASFLMMSFRKVGEDPPKDPVFPRYEPPADMSPAAAHYVFYRGLRGHNALISTLIGLGVKGAVDIDASDKKSTRLTRKAGDEQKTLNGEETDLKTRLFRSASELKLGGKYNAGFTTAYMAFRKGLSRKYGNPYFRWNIGYTLGALVLTVVAIVFAIVQAVNWTGWHTLVVLAFAGLNGLFMYLMPAPTPKGQKVRAEIEGFRLYLETAEKLQLNSVKVGSGAPPPMTVDRYETFLPYAVALGVEKPWTKYFEHQLPEEAAAYSPGWSRFGDRSFRNVGG